MGTVGAAGVTAIEGEQWQVGTRENLAGLRTDPREVGEEGLAPELAAERGQT